MQKILVVDDTPDNLRFVVNCLVSESAPYQILTANNGVIALKVALKTIPNLVLLDWQMPVMDGLETIKAFKQNPELSAIPIIMYTGINTDSENLKEALAAGAIDFLRKPVDPVELIARIQTILSRQQFYDDKIEAERKELSLRVQELTNLAIIIEQKNGFLESLQEEIQSWKSTKPPSNFNKICNQFIAKIDLEINSETQWILLKTKINQLHNNFISKLQEAHPNLTQGDLKLASLIQINLSNKEISTNLSIETGSVEKKKSRLRKKLTLDANAKIEDYLSQFSLDSN
jgi:CheY-like chemotaxis protein/DNA-binding CsgD family transcriptional regulator